MNDVLKNGIRLFAKLIVATIMCFVIAISFSSGFLLFFGEKAGYTAYGVTGENPDVGTELYTYYYVDGDDTQKAEFEAQGYTVIERDIKILSDKGYIICLVLTQLFCAIMIVPFIYTPLWNLGTKENNMVNYKHKTEDKLKGLKIGTIAVIPSVLLLVFLSITKSGFASKLPITLYAFFNAQYYSLIQVICGKGVLFGELSVLQIILLFALQLIIPLIAFLGYYLGYCNFSIGEKLIYKKN